ncbi:Fc.00g044550.m01.CDS01 [Cosmosporella sp. VM-42]
MTKLKRFLSRRRSSRHHALTSPSPIISTTSNPTAAADSAETEVPCLSKFEKLHFDVRREIFLAVDTLEDLRGLVHASPTYHQQYLLNREFWLWRCLQQELGPVLVEAYTVNLSSSLRFLRERTRQNAREFVAAYHLRRSTTTDMFSTTPSTEEVVSIAAFYSSTTQPLLHQYTTWVRTNLAVLTVPDQLSKTERIRILRGLYRFQIFCNLFGKEHDDSGRRLEANERLSLFLDNYEPWEVEEVVCINSFAHAKWQTVLEEVVWDFHRDNPKFDPVRRNCTTPTGAFNLDCSQREWHRDGMISSGLALLWTMFQTQDHSILVDILSETMVCIGEDWIATTISNWQQDKRRENQYSDRDRAQDRRDEMPFKGDRYDSPPLAWVMIWQETCSNIYGSDYLPEKFYSWGYIMWDACRLVDTGAAVVLDQQWREVWEGDDELDDPRNYI